VNRVEPSVLVFSRNIASPNTAYCDASMSLAVAELGSLTGYGTGDDAGTDRQHAGHTPGGATEGALKIQDAGLIDYTRGRIQVLDRKGL
jgi:hypothetical protein